MKYSKIFVIGFNKTATSTLHELFIENKLNSQHANYDKWNINKYTCFSDISIKGTIWNNSDWKNIEKKYSNAIFILNTRGLYDWLISRFKHGLRENNKTKFPWAYPPTLEKCKEWVNTREQYYLDILEYFSDKQEKLIIINIDKDGWQEYLSKILNFKITHVKSINVHKTQLQNIEHINIVNIVNECLKIMNYDKTQLLIKNTNLLNKYLKLYINNILE